MKKQLLVVLFLVLMSFISDLAQAQCTVNAGSNISYGCTFYGDITVPLSTPSGSETINSGLWTTSGTGRFIPDSMNAASYIPSQQDINNSGVTLTYTAQMNCGIAVANILLTIQGNIPLTSITGSSRVETNSIASCGSTPIKVIANSSYFKSLQWTTTGTGTISNSTADSIVYSPSTQDVANGKVVLHLNAIGSGQCNYLDSVVLNLSSNGNSASLGNSLSICLQEGEDVSFNTAFTDTTNVTFAGGAGIFYPDFGSNILTYFPTAAEISAGTVTLTANIPASNNCAAASAQVTITLLPIPNINAGPDKIECLYSSTNYNAVILQASATKTTTNTTYQWTANGTGTFGSQEALYTTYSPSVSDVTRDTITLTLSVINGSGGCSNTANTHIIMTKLSTLNIANPTTPGMYATSGVLTVCGDSIVLNGVTSVPNNGYWLSYGSGYFSPSANMTNTTYYFSSQDKTNGYVNFVFLSKNGCTVPAGIDSLDLTILPADQTVHAGPDQVVNSGNVTLNGQYTGSGTVAWSTNGTGAFTTGNTLTQAIYQPSMNDYTTGMLTFTLTGIDNGSCGNISDNTLVTLGMPYSIQGSITTNSAAADVVQVDLYKLENSTYQYIKTYTGSSAYSFSNISAGTYIVQATLANNSTLCGNGPSCQYLPTYYGEVANWEGAKLITLTNASLTALNIDLLNSNIPNAPIGSDSISGVVTTSISSTSRLISGTSGNNYIQGATVSILNANGQTIYSTQTNAAGQYLCTHLQQGTYTLVIDYPGFEKLSTSISVDTNATSIPFLSSQMEQARVTSTGITQSMSSDYISVYPNPASTELRVDITVALSQNTIIKLIDLCGNVAAVYPISNTSTLLNISSLNNGMYLVQISDGTNIITSKFVKY